MMKDEVENRELTFENKSNTSLQRGKAPIQVSARSLDKGEDENLILNNIIKNAKMSAPIDDSTEKGKSPRK
jgi:hypothetical protein